MKNNFWEVKGGWKRVVRSVIHGYLICDIRCDGFYKKDNLDRTTNWCNLTQYKVVNGISTISAGYILSGDLTTTGVKSITI